MRKVREILRLKDEVKLSHREVAESLGVSIGVVSKVVNRAALAGLTWGAAVELNAGPAEVGCDDGVLVRPADPADVRGDGKPLSVRGGPRAAEAPPGQS